MPKVSVLIPAYNAEKYIEKCIQSVVNQTLKDIEIIIINDGSLDNTKDVIKQFVQDKRIRVIDKKNSGYGATLNLGIKEAKGEYISIVEADDFIDESFLKKLYSFSGYDIIKSNFSYFPQNIEYKLNFEGICTVEDTPEIINIKPSIWSAIYKKDFLLNNGILFNEAKNANYQDVLFHYTTIYSANSIYVLDEPLYFYRTDNPHSSTKTKNKPQAMIKEFNAIDKFNESVKLLPETNAQLILFRLKAYIWNFMKISNLHEDECIMMSSKDFNSIEVKMFFKSRNIKLADKIKLFLLLKNPQILKLMLKLIKKYSKQVV